VNCKLEAVDGDILLSLLFAAIVFVNCFQLFSAVFRFFSIGAANPDEGPAVPLPVR
jgi:hypothetical protein